MLPAASLLVIFCCSYIMSVWKYSSKNKSFSVCYAVHCVFPPLLLQLSHIASSEESCAITSPSFLSSSLIRMLFWVSSSLLSLLAKLSETVPILKSLSHPSFPFLLWWSSIFYHHLYWILPNFRLNIFCVASATGDSRCLFFDSPVPFSSATQLQFLSPSAT